MTTHFTVDAPKRRFSVAEYHRLAELGILRAEDRIELIHGEIIEMSPVGPKHAGNLDRIAKWLNNAVKDSAIVRVQSPIQLGDESEPEPDISLLKPRDDFYTTGHPGPEDVLLIVEVADSSLDYDNRIKLPLYASYGIPELWLVDLIHRLVIVHLDPQEDRYLNLKTFTEGETIISKFIDKKLNSRQLIG